MNLHDEVAKHLQGFPLKGVTIRMLLNHRSGLPNYVHYMEQLGWDKNKRITNKDVLDFLKVNYQKIGIARPDSRFDYSNTNYALLALVIEKVSGKFLGDYLKETIFEPLGMKDTYLYTMADSARSMPSYYLNGKTFAFNFLDLVYGDKNIYSTPRDLLRFDRGLKTSMILKSPILDSAYMPYSFERSGKGNYGLGWRMNLIENGKKIIYHNGWWHGNRTSFIRLLEEDVTIITLCNNDDMKVYSAKRLADIFGDYRQYNDEAPVLVKRSSASKKKSIASSRKKKNSSTARKTKKAPPKSISSRTAKK
jgi:CubicO group peptidase (beta-lactamase class C family)